MPKYSQNIFWKYILEYILNYISILCTFKYIYLYIYLFFAIWAVLERFILQKLSIIMQLLDGKQKMAVNVIFTSYFYMFAS